MAMLLTVVCALPLLTGCDNEDDLKEIFTGKVWKLSYIYTDGAYNLQIDFWDGNQERQEASMALRDTQGNYALEFSGAEINGTFQGSVNGRIVNQTFQGQWQADASSHTLAISNLRFSGNDETDPLAVNFKRGLTNVHSYSGDANGLQLHYRDGNAERVLALFVSSGR